MKLTKLMAMTLALVSSVLAGPIQWSSVDNLVTASSIATTLDKGIKEKVVIQVVQVLFISPNGYLEVEATLLTEAQKNAYNAAIGEVQNDIFQKTAEEYFGEEYVNAQAAMDVAVSEYAKKSSNTNRSSTTRQQHGNSGAVQRRCS